MWSGPGGAKQRYTTHCGTWLAWPIGKDLEVCFWKKVLLIDLVCQAGRTRIVKYSAILGTTANLSDTIFKMQFSVITIACLWGQCGNHYVAGFEPRLVLLSKALYHTCFICVQRCKWWSHRPKLTSSVISDVKPIIYIFYKRMNFTNCTLPLGYFIGRKAALPTISVCFIKPVILWS